MKQDLLGLFQVCVRAQLSEYRGGNSGIQVVVVVAVALVYRYQLDAALNAALGINYMGLPILCTAPLGPMNGPAVELEDVARIDTPESNSQRLTHPSCEN